MLSDTMQKALNEQVNEEYFSHYLYLSMAQHFESVNLKGFASWMKVQAQEELMHATKIMDYINERGGKVILDQIKKPQPEWASPLNAFEDTYNHERHISKCIHNLVDMANKEGDHPTNAFLQWFVTEQVEEESSTSEVVENLKMIGDAKHAIFMMDHHLGSRKQGAE